MTNLTPASQFTSPVQVPDNGEPVVAAAGSGEVRKGFQALTNRTQWLYDQTVPAISYCRTYSDAKSLDGASVVFTSIAPIVVTHASTGAIITSVLTSPITITVADLVGGGAFAASTWYYIYAVTSTGGTTFEISTTAPDQWLAFMTADVHRRYLGCFRTWTDGTILPFTKRGSVYRYLHTEQMASFQVSPPPTTWTSTTLTSAAAVGASALIPPHSTMASLSVVSYNSSALGQLVAFLPAGTVAGGGSNPGKSVISNSTSAASTTHNTIDVMTDATQMIQIKAIRGDALSVVTVYVDGFTE